MLDNCFPFSPTGRQCRKVLFNVVHPNRQVQKVLFHVDYRVNSPEKRFSALSTRIDRLKKCFSVLTTGWTVSGSVFRCSPLKYPASFPFDFNFTGGHLVTLVYFYQNAFLKD